MKRILLFAVAALAGCGQAPTTDVKPTEDDFAFLHVDLEG